MSEQNAEKSNTEHLSDSGKENLSQFADKRPRDKNGHFLPDEKLHAASAKNSVTKLLKDNTAADHAGNDDKLVQVSVNNPLRKITKLLEDIKKQKAFAFTLKGSLGVAGIAVVLTTFGIFGGTKAFCSKGEQSHIGVIRQLDIYPTITTNAILLRVQNAWSLVTTGEYVVDHHLPRVILIQQDLTTYELIGLTKGQSMTAKDQVFIVTGNVDSCSQTITVNDSRGLEKY